MKVSLEKFDEPKWRSWNALVRFFFESGNTRLLAERVETFFREGSIERMGADQEGARNAWRSLEIVRAKFRKLKKACHQAPVIWLRLGFVMQSEGVVLSDSFIASYAEWRKADAEEFESIRVQFRSGARPTETWPLDYFLHGRNLEFEIPSKFEVRLIGSHQRSGTTTKRTCSDVVGR